MYKTCKLTSTILELIFLLCIEFELNVPGRGGSGFLIESLYKTLWVIKYFDTKKKPYTFSKRYSLYRYFLYTRR